MKKLDRAFKKVNIKGKEYIEVKERILALVENEEPYSIETEYQYFDSRKMWVVKATLTMKTTWEVFTWLAQEIESDDYKSVNSTSALENAETSAVGRACAFAGIWVIDSIASADEVNKAINRWSNFGNWPKTENTREWLNDKDFDKKIVDWCSAFTTKQQFIDYANEVKQTYKLSKDMQERLKVWFEDKVKKLS